MADISEKAKVLDIKGAITTLIISAFGFVAALSWNNAIQDMIKQLVPSGSGLLYSLSAAILVTIIAVAVIYLLSKYMTVSVREVIKSRTGKQGKAWKPARIKCTL